MGKEGTETIRLYKTERALSVSPFQARSQRGAAGGKEGIKPPAGINYSRDLSRRGSGILLAPSPPFSSRSPSTGLSRERKNFLSASEGPPVLFAWGVAPLFFASSAIGGFLLRPFTYTNIVPKDGLPSPSRDEISIPKPQGPSRPPANSGTKRGIPETLSLP